MHPQDAAAPVRSIDGRLGCSTISLRKLPLPDALAQISALGFAETDLGSLPGTCQHVPTPLPPELVDVLAGQIRDSGVAVRLINADVADMDDPELDEPELRRRLGTLVELAQAVGTSTIMLPSGRKGTTPRTELRRDIATVARTDRLVVTLENHTVIGGLSEAVASTIAYAGVGSRVVPIALPDEFLAAGALPTLHDRYGLSTDSIISKVKAELDSHATGAIDPDPATV